MLPTFRILIIVLQSELKNQITSLLDREKYILESVSTAKAAEQRLANQRYDLIICQENLQDQSGFRLFKKLEERLYYFNTGFFIILNKISIEDLQFGLELGLDNFIFIPIQPGSFINKVEKRLKKSLQFNFYATERFKMLFHSSPVPMFFSENHVISEVNDSFTSLFHFSDNGQKKIELYDIFDLSKNQKNKLLIRKLENGLIEHCWLADVLHSNFQDTTFSLYKSSLGDLDKNKFLTIVLPTKKYGGDDKPEIDCPVFGTCLKSITNGNSKEINEIDLTTRELEVFKLSAGGVPIKQIAEQLHLSERTIEKHRSNIMKKAETHSMMEAVLKIQKNQLLISKFNS